MPVEDMTETSDAGSWRAADRSAARHALLPPDPTACTSEEIAGRLTPASDADIGRSGTPGGENGADACWRDRTRLRWRETRSGGLGQGEVGEQRPT